VGSATARGHQAPRAPSPTEGLSIASSTDQPSPRTPRTVLSSGHARHRSGDRLSGCSPRSCTKHPYTSDIELSPCPSVHDPRIYEQASVLRGFPYSALCDHVASPSIILPHTDANRAKPPGARKIHGATSQPPTRGRFLDPPRVALGRPHS